MSNRKIREIGGSLNPFASKTWRHVVTVKGYTHWQDEDGNVTGESIGYWVLSERADGRRRITTTGDAGTSEFALNREAAVEAWFMGGEEPSSDVTAKDPPAKPKPKPQAKSEGNLIPFPGNKR